MRLHHLIRIMWVACIVLLCVGFAVYSINRLHEAEDRRKVNLYSLVPQDVTAVFETDRFVEWVENMDSMHCSRDGHVLQVSSLFSFIKDRLPVLLQETPHGLSWEMNNVLVSFHQPDSPLNQVLYCRLGPNDHALLQSFMQQHGFSDYPSKTFDYKGYRMTIYPMADGRFLSIWVNRDFLVLSFQKRLVEQAMDAHRKKNALLQLKSFRSMYQEERTGIGATLYLNLREGGGRYPNLWMGNKYLGDWLEFDVKLAPDAIYCSGMSHGNDSVATYLDVLHPKQALEGFSGENLPASTFFYFRKALSEKDSLFRSEELPDTLGQEQTREISRNNRLLVAYLQRNVERELTSCVFLSDDSLQQAPCTVLRMGLRNVPYAEWELREWVGEPMEMRSYRIPFNSVWSLLAGASPGSLSEVYATFYKGNLLLASDASHLSAYRGALEREETLTHMPMFRTLAENLSPTYDFVMMGDMEDVVSRPEAYTGLIPSFFARHASFFRHFLFSVQFVCTDGVLYPNLVFWYKPL